MGVSLRVRLSVTSPRSFLAVSFPLLSLTKKEMTEKRKNWTKEELIVAFNLYCKIPFSKINYRNDVIIKLANSIGRTPSAVAWKLVNFASLDPSLTKKGIKGATNTSKLDKMIFKEFTNNWEELAYESEKLLANYFDEDIESKVIVTEEETKLEGKDKTYKTKVRINQSFFRATVLASYDNKCCLTGIKTSPLLVASHIIPWSKNKENRLNPQNGICLNNLHDRAFDRGLISFGENFQLILSEDIMNEKSKGVKNYFIDLIGQKIDLPKKFLPNQEFLDYHRNNIFMK